MEAPNVPNYAVDQKAGVNYVVMAYRKLSTEETIQFVRLYWSQCKKKDRPKRGHTITIVTVAGAEGY